MVKEVEESLDSKGVFMKTYNIKIYSKNKDLYHEKINSLYKINLYFYFLNYL